MIAVLERPLTIDGSPVLYPPTGAAARDLALAYLRYASACWRGDPRAEVFATQLGSYSRSNMPPRPALPAAAVSPHGGGGRGVHWYQTAGEVVGYVPGTRGGYRVPRLAIPQLVRCASAAIGAIPPDLAPRTTADGRGAKRHPPCKGAVVLRAGNQR